MFIEGIGASKGIAIGKIFVKNDEAITISQSKIDALGIQEEIVKFETAKKTAIEELNKLYEKAVKEVGEEHAQIFDVHKMLVEDLDFHDQVVAFINGDAYNVVHAVSETGEMFAEIFANMEDAYMRERAADIRDIAKRLIGILTGHREKSLADLDEPVIVVAKDLYPSDTIQMNKDFVIAFITEEGGKMSHSAILARTMQIPAVVGCHDALKLFAEGDQIILDGASGKMIKNPDEATRKEWEIKREEYLAYKKELQALIGTPNRTKDGVDIKIYANIGSPNDIKGVLENDTKGIGLFRSEFLYMDGDKMPTEEEQFVAYKKVLEAMDEQVVIRTLDIGGDKELSYLNIPKEENPFLGYRAIRICLQEQEMFKVQLRALLRASAYGKLAIMFPMIATVEELKAAKAILEETKQELIAEGVKVSDEIEVGIMIETPAAVLASDLLAEEADFFSIGTNDLTQYTLAVDRMNTKIANLYDTHNISVLRSIKMVAENAHKAGIWVGICGESAADTELTETYLAIGIDELSVSAGSVLELRKKVQSLSTQEAKQNIKL